jgi:hypothetical protein
MIIYFSMKSLLEVKKAAKMRNSNGPTNTAKKIQKNISEQVRHT